MAKDKDKDAILAAADAVFQTKGASSTSLEEIAKQAKLDLKHVKAAYSSADALLNDVISRDVEESSDLFTKIMNDRGKADIKLTRLVRELLTRYQKRYPLFHLASYGLENTSAEDDFLRGRVK